MKKKIFVCVLVCVCVLVGCKSSQQVEVVTKTLHDTVVSNLVRYDSVYIDRWCNSEVHGDTVYRDRTRTEYRLRLIHDTTLVARCDTIPITVITEKPVRYVPLWCKCFGVFGVVCVVAGGIFIARRCRRFSRYLITPSLK